MSIRLAPLMRVVADVGEVISLGAAAGGERRMVAITGGMFEGEELSGEVLRGGADWQVSGSRRVLLPHGDALHHR